MKDEYQTQAGSGGLDNLDTPAGFIISSKTRASHHPLPGILKLQGTWSSATVTDYMPINEICRLSRHESSQLHVFFGGTRDFDGKEQFLGSCLHHYAYRKIIK